MWWTSGGFPCCTWSGCVHVCTSASARFPRHDSKCACVCGAPKSPFMIAGVQLMIFNELISIRFSEAKELNVQGPWFRTVQWLWFLVAMFHSYGAAWLKVPLWGKPVLQAIKRILPYGISTTGVFQVIALLLYSGTFVITVLSLQPGLYKHQIAQLSWTGLIITGVVGQIKTAVFSIHQGLFFLVFPASLVICNDTMAYVCGFFLGKKLIDAPFLALSPNKTWEGFLGAFVCTVIYAFYGSMWLGEWAWLRCSFPELQTIPYPVNELGSCAVDKYFQPEKRVQGAPPRMQTVALSLAVFASLVAPFGGFFASAVKRAFKLKDFASYIPGHGGLTDRMDCQLIMILAAWVAFTTFTPPPEAEMSLPDVYTLAKRLSRDDQIYLADELQEVFEE